MIKVTSTAKNSICLQIEKVKTKEIDLKLRIQKAGVEEFFKDVQGNEETASKWNNSSEPDESQKQYRKLTYIADEAIRLRDRIEREMSSSSLFDRTDALLWSAYQANDGSKLLSMTISFDDQNVDEPKKQ